MSSELAEVETFYFGKTVFITGGTGFLDKALTEKILYNCSDISKIYLLVREKKGKSARERINQLFNIPAFERLNSRPDCLSKLIVFPGDVTKTNLGLTSKQLKCLIQEVSIVFHLAATVNFNETLQEALDVNVMGTMEVMNLCRQMKHLQAFIHVSTAFSNADRSDVDEIVYPPPHDLEQAFQIAKHHSDNNNYDIRKMGGKPNTYTYSKALAEDVVVKCGDIPTAIVRPSIGKNSPGLILKLNSSSGVKVYNCCTGSSNPITCNECNQTARKVALKYSLNAYPWPYLIFTTSYILYYILFFILQIVPAYIIDLLPIKKKTESQLKIQLKFNKMVHALQFFIVHEWNFIDENVQKLWLSMSKRDKAISMFNFNVKSIDWEKCLEDYILGARKYLLKDRSM